MDSIEEGRASLASKSRIRELVFGMQDGTMSTVGLLAGMQGATDRRALVMLAGITAVFSGAISMAAGAYLAARAEKDIVDHERGKASTLAESEPYLAQEGILEALAKEGLTREQAYRVVGVLSSSRRVLLSTFHEKVFGLGAVELNQPVRGAVVMAVSFIAGGTIPLVPYILLPGRIALAVSASLAAFTLFGVGAFKGRLAGQKSLRAGAGFFVVAVGAAALGYLIGLAADALVPGAGVAAG